MFTKGKSFLWAGWLALFCCVSFAVAQKKPAAIDKPPSSITAQDPVEEVVRVNTRVVFVDVLVRDKRTGAPVADLTRDDFTVLDDGRERELAYFGFGDRARRPRLLLLVIDFFGGDGRSFHNEETVPALASALAKLPPEDELAIAAAWLGKDASPCSELERISSADFPPLQVVQDFTRDRAKVIASLERVPALVEKYNRKVEELSKTANAKDTANTYANAASAIPCAADALRRAAAQRPNSQAVMVVATDDLVYFPYAARDEMIRGFLETGITVNLLRIRRSFLTGMMAGIGRKAAGYREVPGTIEVVGEAALRTGGETARVGSVKKYVAEFEKLVGSLTSRYALGFTLKEDEQNTNRLHKLEVRVRARNNRGRKRKVIVSARSGYYPPNE